MDIIIDSSIHTYKEINFEVNDVSKYVTKEDGSNDGVWYHQGHLDPENEIIIGFSPTNYHTFIVSGDKELHCRFSFNKCKTLRSRKYSIRAGMFVRVQGIPKNELKAFQDYLQSIHGLRTPSCHIGALQALDKGLGITLIYKNQYSLNPSQVIYTALKNGMRDRNGTPLKLSLYTTRSKTLKQIFNEVHYFERYFIPFYFVSKLVYNLIWNQFHRKSLVKWKQNLFLIEAKDSGVSTPFT